MAHGRTGQPRLLRTGHGVRVAAGLVMVSILALGALVALSVAAMGAGWRREVRTVVGRIELVDRLLTIERSASGTPSPAARPARPTRIPSLLLGTPQAVSGTAGVNVAALTDGQVTQRAGAWRTREGQITAELRYTTSPAAAERVVFAHSAAFPPETWAKEVEVWLSIGPDTPDELRAGRWTLSQTTGEQSFAFPRVSVHGVRLRVLSNYGSREYTSLAEFALPGE